MYIKCLFLKTKEKNERNMPFSELQSVPWNKAECRH